MGTNHAQRITTTSQGRNGEEMAWQHLQDQGWILLDRNWHCRYSEIDLVCSDPQGELVVVEVKYRQSTQWGGGIEAVTKEKLRRLRLAASLWLSAHNRDENSREWIVRFDVIDVGPDGVRKHLQGVE